MFILSHLLFCKLNHFFWTEGSPHSSNGNFLLSEDFLKACREKYSALPEINQSKTFSQKFMNLVDPLRPFNNLGRSVNSGNHNLLSERYKSCFVVDKLTYFLWDM